MSLQINFNGKNYNNLDEMPPEERQAYEMVTKLFADENQNGVPDLLENAPANTTMQTTTFVVDGKTYSSADEMPADARQRYQAAISKMDANQDDMPDWLRAMKPDADKPAKSEEVPAWLSSMNNASDNSSNPPAIVTEPEGTDFRLALMGCAVILLLILAGG